MSQQTKPPTLLHWLANVTEDPRALSWFDHPEAEGRVRRAFGQLLDGYNHDPARILKTTRLVKDDHQGIVTVQNINYFSLCAHHFLPFFGQIAISYLPGSKIIGLGKFPRLVQIYSRRFQIQEDLVKEIAEEIMTSGGAKGVLVTSDGRHLCMCSRGPSDHTVKTLTSYSLGQFRGATDHGALRV